MKTYDVIMTPSDDGHWVLKSEADREIHHHKYKRCLDIVHYCDLKMSYWANREIYEEDDTGKFELYFKWYQRWLNIAEKFKPNSTAQRAKDTNHV